MGLIDGETSSWASRPLISCDISNALSNRPDNNSCPSGTDDPPGPRNLPSTRFLLISHDQVIKNDRHTDRSYVAPLGCSWIPPCWFWVRQTWLITLFWGQQSFDVAVQAPPIEPKEKLGGHCIDVLVCQYTTVWENGGNIPTPSNFLDMSLTIGSGCLPSAESLFMISLRFASRSLNGSSISWVYAPVSDMCNMICYPSAWAHVMPFWAETYSHADNLTICSRRLSALSNCQKEETEEGEYIW